MLIYFAFNIIDYIFRFASGNWISLFHPTPAGAWSLKMTVNLSERSDTGNINQSPVSSMASSIIVSSCVYSIDVYIPGK